MSWSPAETEIILEEMRAGAGVTIGGSRCHMTYSYRDGSFRCEAFDEGDTRESPMSEGSLRELIAREPEAFREVLRGPRWRRFSKAFLEGRRDDAREALGLALEYGDPLLHGALLRATIDWPETPPSPELAARWRKELRELTAYHVFMDAALWDRSAEIGRHGVAFVDRLAAMLGPAMGLFYVRAAFHQQAGDLDAAEADLLVEIQGAANEEWHRTYFEDRLKKLRALRAVDSR